MQKIAKIIAGFCLLAIVVPMLLAMVLQQVDPEVGIVVTVLAAVIALMMLPFILQPANLIAKLTQQDRYILAIEFVKLQRTAFSMHAGHGRYGYLPLEEARNRVSRMVDIGVLRLTPSGTYELTRDGKATIKRITVDEARPQ